MYLGEVEKCRSGLIYGDIGQLYRYIYIYTCIYILHICILEVLVFPKMFDSWENASVCIFQRVETVETHQQGCFLKGMFPLSETANRPSVKESNLPTIHFQVLC